MSGIPKIRQRTAHTAKVGGIRVTSGAHFFWYLHLSTAWTRSRQPRYRHAATLMYAVRFLYYNQQRPARHPERTQTSLPSGRAVIGSRDPIQSSRIIHQRIIHAARQGSATPQCCRPSLSPGVGVPNRGLRIQVFRGSKLEKSVRIPVRCLAFDQVNSFLLIIDGYRAQAQGRYFLGPQL
ncbi:hypothetical protein BDV95DRAFT_101859 [Massariosphaeria phaeospora]|uniref:Uncharacterized protein n=1 Tax=Massariosphaeria phaeospora TaxID=100035 RepID=A0A7C8IAU6_9PLEO|nr:hypothetical protein BDV95DRAFT_101859 [Massariosphaeria phaeospora]